MKYTTIAAMGVGRVFRINGYNVDTSAGVCVYMKEGTLDAAGAFTDLPGFPLAFNIQGTEYALLLSANPVWSPLKPAGTFRESDLLSFIGR